MREKTMGHELADVRVRGTRSTVVLYSGAAPDFR